MTYLNKDARALWKFRILQEDENGAVADRSVWMNEKSFSICLRAFQEQDTQKMMQVLADNSYFWLAVQAAQRAEGRI